MLDIHYYFAYGSNMNSARVVERGLEFSALFPATLDNVELCFNKRAVKNPDMAYANVIYSQESHVEGVVYQLSDTCQINKMDYFEGSPVRYSRELFWVRKPDGSKIAAWVYVANQAMLADGLRPASWYLEHLLAGEQYLTPAYFEKLSKTLTC
ncbi:MAG: gamma-glutamylcyclotransferase [Pseudomonadales bacterium]|nr:gamma-glutamylcyclotransferase [Pseudomonadales bacterium]